MPLLRSLLPVAVAVVLVASGCGSDETTSDASGGDAPTTVAANGWTRDTATAPQAPSITRPDGDPPEDLVSEDVRTGDGATLAEGQLAVVDYIGANWSNGEVFDSSFDRAPFAFILGSGAVIEGWDQGLVGMAVGGRRQLILPPDVAYGDQAQGEIPANETLIFVVDLIDARPRPKPSPETEPVEKLTVVDLVPGSGDRTLTSGDQALVHYTGVLASTGEEFDSSWDSGQPFPFQFGTGSVIAGWDQGLEGMKPGGRRRLVIPAELAYGAQGSEPKIPPNAALVFEVDLIALA